jgi:transcriptional regulator of heat shock response
MNIVPVSSALIDNYHDNIEGQTKETKIAQESFYTWFKKMPEVTGVVGAVSNDLLGDGFEFRGTKAGIVSAQTFCKKNNFYKKLYSIIQDFVLLGDAYLGIRIIQDNYINKFSDFDDIQKEFGGSLIEKLKVRSPDLFYPREVFPLKSSTIYPDYDEHGRVRKYIQKVNGNAKEVAFTPDEIIHFSLNNIGNEFFGTSPMESCLNDICTLWYAKDYAGMFFQNDGTPDKFYILEDTAPGSTEFESFKKSIKEFKSAKNKHQSMVMTGKVTVQNVNEFNKDLEFATLIDKFTQRIRMAWNMPTSRLDENGKGSSSKEALAGYYKNINRMQLEIEEILNNELWSRFGDVEMAFNRAYKRDESVEADIVSKTVGKPTWTQNEGRIYMGLKPLTDAKYDEIQEDFTENPGGQMPDTKSGEEVGNQERLAQKMEKNTKNLTLQTFNDFVSLVESDGRVFEKSGVCVDDLSDTYKFFFTDNGVVYESQVSKLDSKTIQDFDSKFLNVSTKVDSKPEEQMIVSKNISELVSVLDKTNSKMDNVVNKFSEVLDKKTKEESDRFDKFVAALEKSNANVNLAIQGVSNIANSKSENDSEKLSKFIEAIDKTNSKVSLITKEVSKMVENKSSIDSDNIKNMLSELNKTNTKLQNIAGEVSKIDKSEKVEFVKGGSSAVIVSMDSFKEFCHIVEADGRTFMTAKVFCNETPASYDFCFADSVAMYESSVAKSDIQNEKDFRFRYVDYSFKGKLK